MHGIVNGFTGELVVAATDAAYKNKLPAYGIPRYGWLMGS